MADQEQQEPDDITMFSPVEPTPPAAPYVPPPAPTPPPVAGQAYQPYGAPPPAPYGLTPPPVPVAFDPNAPFGVDPLTGLPYSDKTKLVAGLLQVLLPFGVGRFYMGNTGMGVAQLLVTIFTCGLGSLWPFIDGIMILVGNPRDALGRPMKMS